MKNSNSLFGFESFLQLEPICCTNQWKIALGTLQEGKTKTWDLRGLNYAKMHLTVTRDAFSWPCVIFCIVDQLVIQTFWDLKCAKKGLKQKLTKIGLALNKIVSKWPKIEPKKNWTWANLASICFSSINLLEKYHTFGFSFKFLCGLKVAELLQRKMARIMSILPPSLAPH